MKSKLQPLQELKLLKRLKPLKQGKRECSPRLSSIEMILYSTNLCYYATRIIHNQIKVKNKDDVLMHLRKEIKRVHKIISDDEFLINSDNYLTKKQRKENLKRFGITPKKLEY